VGRALLPDAFDFDFDFDIAFDFDFDSAFAFDLPLPGLDDFHYSYLRPPTPTASDKSVRPT